MLGQLLGISKGHIHPGIGFGFQSLGVICNAIGEFTHMIPIGQTESDIAMAHDEVFIPSFFMDEVDQAGGGA